MHISIKDIDKMRPSQKIKLVDDILSSMSDLPISKEVHKELDRRDREMDKEGGISWSNVKKKMVIK